MFRNHNKEHKTMVTTMVTKSQGLADLVSLSVRRVVIFTMLGTSD